MDFNVAMIFNILAFCTNVIAAAAFFYNFEGHGKIYSGHAPDEGWWNYGYYVSFSLFAFGLICLIFAVIEILLLIIPDKLSFIDSPILRGVVYIITGIAVLGCANDLGIAAGALQLIIGLAMVIFGILKMAGVL